MDYDVRFLGVEGRDFLKALKPGTKISGSLQKMIIGEESKIIRKFSKEDIPAVCRLINNHCGLFDRLQITEIAIT